MLHVKQTKQSRDAAQQQGGDVERAIDAAANLGWRVEGRTLPFYPLLPPNLPPPAGGVDCGGAESEDGADEQPLRTKKLLKRHISLVVLLSPRSRPRQER